MKDKENRRWKGLTNTATMGQTSRITHTIFKEMKDNTDNFGR